MKPEFHHEAFKSNLTTLEPLIKKLTEATTVIWMEQLPLIERHIEYLFRHPDEQSFDALVKYNAMAREALK
jgi:hypothetical protein